MGMFPQTCDPSYMQYMQHILQRELLGDIWELLDDICELLGDIWELLGGVWELLGIQDVFPRWGAGGRGRNP